MKIIKANLGGTTATLEVAKSEEDKATGFMFRDSCPPNHGILFVYDKDVTTPYTMKNVKIPLSIALLDGNMSMIEVIDMDPGEALYQPMNPYRYAVEMPRGWFDRHCLNNACSFTV